jgi:hypothetical protein
MRREIILPKNQPVHIIVDDNNSVTKCKRKNYTFQKREGSLCPIGKPPKPMMMHSPTPTIKAYSAVYRSVEQVIRRLLRTRREVRTLSFIFRYTKSEYQEPLPCMSSCPDKIDADCQSQYRTHQCSGFLQIPESPCCFDTQDLFNFQNMVRVCV